MSDRDVTVSLPEAMIARLKELDGLRGMQVRPIPALIPPLTQREILDAAVELVPTLDPARITTLTELSPRQPSVDGIAFLDFETVAFYTAGGSIPFATIGTVTSDAESPPLLRLILANAPEGFGVLVTFRVQDILIDPTFPGFFRVEGPGLAASFEVNGNPTTFTFFVPAGGPVAFKIHTDPDRIRLWGFFDCRITQV